MLRVARGAILTIVSVACATGLIAQVPTNRPAVVANAKPVTVERIKVHSAALEGNLEGNSADRDVLVVLPPGYSASRSRRYPVVYALHGYSIGVEQWIKEIYVPQTIEGSFAKGTPEFIVVLPDSKTVHAGSMYSNSVTTGDFENFVARDLVAYIDAHYRTIADRGSRGLLGHSMGGYGTARIGMKHPEVFGALYMMSPCCLSARPAPANAADAVALENVKTQADAVALPLGQRMQLAGAAAWSPNPKKPPLYVDLPTKDGVAQPDVLARWAANAPLALLSQYVGNLRRYRALAIDVGDRDGLRVDAAKLHDALDQNGIANSFEIYPGTHVSDVGTRVQDFALPFFGRSLSFTPPRSGSRQ